MSERWLAIVPARGGSKGIPQKNLALVGGRPLIAFTLDALRSALEEIPGLVGFVSTDDLAIRAAAEAVGFPVPVLRPASLSHDHSPSMGYVRHALEWHQKRGQSFDGVLVLQPTSPLRPARVIKEAVRRMEEVSEASSLISGFLERLINPDILYLRGPDGRGAPLTKRHNAGGRRQDVAPVFVRNGAIYAARTRFIEATQRFVDDRPLLLEMSKEESLNIDHPSDLEALRARIAAAA